MATRVEIDLLAACKAARWYGSQGDLEDGTSVSYLLDQAIAQAEASRPSEPIPSIRDALHRIAYEPFGAADATHKEVLDAITAFARETLAKADIR